MDAPELGKAFVAFAKVLAQIPPIVINPKPINIYSEGKASFVFVKVNSPRKSANYTALVASVHPEAVKADLKKHLNYTP